MRWWSVGDEFEGFKKGEVEASCKVGEGLLNYQVVQFMAFGPQTSFRRTPSDPNMFSDSLSPSASRLMADNTYVSD